MFRGEFRAYVNSFLVLAFFLTFNLLSKNGFGFWENVARSCLIASTILISIVLLLGPLSRLFPKKFSHDLLYRKPLGLAGTLLALVYFLIVVFNTYRLDLGFQFSAANPDFFAWVFWALALIILLVLSVMSLPYYIRRLGFGNWKTLQIIGYSALVFMGLHLMAVNGGYFLGTISGRSVFALVVMTLIFKTLAILFGITKRHSKFESDVLTSEH